MFPVTAPPLSSTTYSLPFIINFVPNANCEDAATVRPAVAFVPDAVYPVAFPQHLAHEQYAVTLNIFVVPEEVSLVIVPPLDVTFCWTWTILLTGSFITFSESFVLSISSSFWYFILYVTSFIPSSPCCITLFYIL